jgi:hypothetical protein
MKKLLLVCVVVIAALGLTAQTNNLPRLAVVEFNTNDTSDRVKKDAITVRSIVESQMVATGKYQIISREEIDKLLANQKIQASSISSAENIKKLQMTNISYIVTGSLDAMGNDYAVTIKILDVSTGQFSHSANALVGSGSRELYSGITGLAGRFAGGMSSSEGQVVQTGPDNRGGAGRVYTIGDIGPAGGIVFYDKGTFSGGWRYLEAAPAETEFTAQWGAYEKTVGGTATAVGSGKRNTQGIVEFLQRQGERGKAAQLCTALDFDGFKDWFLPSKDELDLMYKNLKAKGLGDFSNGWYWSSSELSSANAWGQSFGGGDQLYGYKPSTGSVRAVRAF